jgi:hypothetical protein
VQQVKELSQPVGWELNGEMDCVDDPSQDHFTCCPRGVPFIHFLDRSRLLVILVAKVVQGAKDLVQVLKEDMLDVSTMGPRALDHTNKIVYVHFPRLHWRA